MFGLDLLIQLDNIAQGKETEMALKAAVLAAGYSEPDRLFPDHFAPPDIDEAEAAAEAAGEDVVYDTSDVNWLMPSDEDPTETLRLLQQMGGLQHLSLSESDGSGDFDFDDEPVPAPGFDAVAEEDREWL